MELGRQEFTGTPDSIELARAFVGQYFERGTEPYDNAVLLTSEAATNAIRYAHGGYAITLEDLGFVVRVSVADNGGGPTAPQPRRAEGHHEGGRGLFLIEACSLAWGFESQPGGGNRTWFDLPATHGLLAA